MNVIRSLVSRTQPLFINKWSSCVMDGVQHCTTFPVTYLPVRGVVFFSKLGKRKTVKAVAKRFKRTGSGALKFWRPGKNHRMLVKSGRASRELRKPRYANKTQLKMLNKMLSGL